jgi:hypothetical protein
VAPTRNSKKRTPALEDKPDLTQAQTKELLRRLADSNDPRRYLIISRMLPGARFVLYYNVSDDVYAWNEPGAGTLFKRRKAAELLQRTLGRGNEILEVKLVRGKVIGAPRRRPKTRRQRATRNSGPARAARRSKTR